MEGQAPFMNVNCTSKEILQRIAEIDPLHNRRFQNMDEINFGWLFATVFEDVLLFNTTAKQWYTYDGILWSLDEQGLKTDGLAQGFAWALRVYVAQSMSKDSSHFENEYLRYVNTLGSRSKRQKMVEDSKTHLLVKALDFDPDRYLLNVQNGVIDLRTMKLLDHDPKLLLSKVCNASYDTDAYSERWASFIDEVMEGDWGKIDYLQRMIGYSLVGDNSNEDFFILLGKSTRNGKSTLLGTIQEMMGSYAMSISPESLAQRKKDGRQASGDIARLNGCRFLQCSEPPRGMILDVAQVKLLTGRDPVPCRHLYGDIFEFIPIFTMFMNANSLPLINDLTLFTSNRVKIIEFNRHFAEEEQDIHLKDELTTPQSLSAVLNWCLDGLKEYAKTGRKIPDVVRQATDSYANESDKMQMFIDECLLPKSSSNIQYKMVYDTYRDWCSSNGYMAESKKNFKQSFTAKIPIAKTGTVNGITYQNVVLGYTINPEGLSV